MKKIYTLFIFITGCSSATNSPFTNNEEDAKISGEDSKSSEVIIESDSLNQNDSATIENDSGNDSNTSDSNQADTNTNDSNPMPGIQCGTSFCTNNYICCNDIVNSRKTCKASCSPDEAAIECTSPNDCDANNPICCATSSVTANFGYFENKCYPTGITKSVCQATRCRENYSTGSVTSDSGTVIFCRARDTNDGIDKKITEGNNAICDTKLDCKTAGQDLIMHCCKLKNSRAPRICINFGPGGLSSYNSQTSPYDCLTQ